MTDPRDEPPIDAEHRDPAEGGCRHCRDPRTCEECAAELRDLMRTRALTARLAAEARSALESLKRLAGLHAELAGSYWYQEFYRDFAEDADSLDAVTAAQQAVRSVARIARERVTRTRQDP